MPNSDDALSSALAHLREALALLDGADAPAHIGAHVDLAAHQLQELVQSAEPRALSGSLRNGQET